MIVPKKVLVNNELGSPHHMSDGVHKDKCYYIVLLRKIQLRKESKYET